MTPLLYAKCAEEYYTAGGTLENALKLAHMLQRSDWLAEQKRKREAIKAGNESRNTFKAYKGYWGTKRKRTTVLKNFKKG